MELSEVKPIFDKLYEKIDGRALSLKGRELHEYKTKSFVYGEVIPDSFIQLMSVIEPKPGQIFYDLGSGTGKAVLLATMLYDFKKVIGIEFLEELYVASAKVKKRFDLDFLPKLREKVKTQTSLIFGNFLDVDLDDADIVFMNSTCFQEDLMLALDQKLSTLKPGTQIISLSKSLKSPIYQVYKSQLYDFSWGQGTAFYHRKL